MEVKKSIFLIALLITAFLLSTILLLGDFLNNERKSNVEERMEIISDLNDIQTFSLLSDVYGNKLACLAFKSKLADWDKTLWNLGLKLEQYRVATEEFQKDPFYIEQKKKFNENELLYMAFLTKAKNECNLTQNIISFFYRKSELCKKCDDQSFVLTDVKRMLEDQVSIFSFDSDLNITSVQLLERYYEIDQYPCIVINEEKFCGIQDRNFILDKLGYTE
ncbi:hypothetical protein JXB28_00915 [Candidatus Woesearchaeota archaeon]|nr:hypothetical protein [Candidatus Woesearchaeota archaeon]